MRLAVTHADGSEECTANRYNSNMADPVAEQDPASEEYVARLREELGVDEIDVKLASKVVGAVARKVVEGGAANELRMWELVYAAITDACEEDDDDDMQSTGYDDERPVLNCGMKPGKRIGKGGFGEVWKSIDDTGAVFAVKVMHEKAMSSEGAQQEYEVLKMLSHRNIVKVWDFVKSEGTAEIIMSYWTQGSIAHQLEEFGNLPITTVKRYAVQLLSGLAYLHSCDVIHADIKPANMLVDATGSVALTDFGLCNVARTVSGSGAIIGTPLYISPSAINGKGDAKTNDIWAFGCSILEMATGLRPWSDVHLTEPTQWYFYVGKSVDKTPYDNLPEGVTVPPDLKSFGQRCFSEEISDCQELMCHPFITGKAAIHRHTAELWSTVEEGAHAVMLFYKQGEVPTAEEVEELIGKQSAVQCASPYKRGIHRACAPEDKMFSNQEGLRLYPSKYRPAYALLSMLGRNDDRGLLELGTPNIVLTTPLSERVDECTTITINAQNIQEIYDTEKACDKHIDPLERKKDVYEGVTAQDVYGDGEFSITIGELKRLAESTFVSTSGDFSRKFLKELTAVLSGKGIVNLDVACKYWSLLRATSLEKIGLETEEEIQHLLSSLGHNKAIAAEDAKGICSVKLVGLHSDMWTEEYVDFLPKVTLLQEHIRAWRSDVKVSTFEHGFPSSADAKAVFQQSIGELCNSTCTSQQGYFLVEGCYDHTVQGYSYNQLTGKTPVPITFLSAAGIDFRKPAVKEREMPKYFTGSPNNWGDFRKLGRHSLKQRVKNIYKSVFECAMHHKVRCLSMLPMGLGIFLTGIPASHRQAVRRAYFEAQFELLSEEDWGFEAYYLNVTDRDEVSGILHDVARTHRWPLRCSIILHSRDTKFLAVELAKKHKAVGVLNPSDCSALMWGIMGAQWETGRYDLYSGEQDMCAHSTALLAHANLRS
eukprot:TRINITY_DN747_c0_g1_i11.p1 TRINITY_DN747_c0_g1~~TRINITY_DN747_c0_g1_i11.p1  ORF type:complete len:936 (+),score=308.88 TRINITY_DN747_c0_g1_i11:109-2916(+)